MCWRASARPGRAGRRASTRRCARRWKLGSGRAEIAAYGAATRWRFPHAGSARRRRRRPSPAGRTRSGFTSSSSMRIGMRLGEAGDGQARRRRRRQGRRRAARESPAAAAPSSATGWRRGCPLPSSEGAASLRRPGARPARPPAPIVINSPNCGSRVTPTTARPPRRSPSPRPAGRPQAPVSSAAARSDLGGARKPQPHRARLALMGDAERLQRHRIADRLGRRDGLRRRRHEAPLRHGQTEGGERSFASASKSVWTGSPGSSDRASRVRRSGRRIVTRGAVHVGLGPGLRACGPTRGPRR